MIYTQSEEFKMVSLGEQFDINFENVPTGAGYKWIVIDRSGMTLLGEQFSTPKSVGDLVSQKFTFIAVRVGDFTLRFHLTTRQRALAAPADDGLAGLRGGVDHIGAATKSIARQGETRHAGLQDVGTAHIEVRRSRPGGGSTGGHGHQAQLAVELRHIKGDRGPAGGVSAHRPGPQGDRFD